MTARASWMFEDHYPETFGHNGQVLSMAVLRFYVIARGVYGVGVGSFRKVA